MLVGGRKQDHQLAPRKEGGRTYQKCVASEEANIIDVGENTAICLMYDFPVALSAKGWRHVVE